MFCCLSWFPLLPTLLSQPLIGVKNALPSATKVSTDTQWHRWCSLWISALRGDELSPLSFFWRSAVTVRFLLGKLTVTLWEHTWDMLLRWTSSGISLACAHHEAQKRTPSSSFLEDRMLWALSEKVIFFFLRCLGDSEILASLVNFQPSFKSYRW